MITDIKKASINREESIWMNEIDNRIDLLLSNYQTVTANPRSMGYLRFLLKHYAKYPHPWRQCFTADTLVETNLDSIPISQLNSSHLVWSYNQKYSDFELCRVNNSWISKKRAKVYRLTLSNGKYFDVTNNHKFLLSDNTWVELKNIKLGQKFKECGYTKVEDIKPLFKKQDVWDIEVESNHNFVVSGVIAHNCYHDNLKRFGAKTPALCGVLKDSIRQNTHWRGHPELDHGTPGVAIGDADAKAAPPWGGHRHLSELDFGEMAMPDELALILEDLGNQCDPYRVLIGLDEPPFPSKELEGLLL